MREEDRPVAIFTGQNGNVFNLIGIARRALKEAGYREEAEEMTERIQQSRSYDEALTIMNEYVDVE
jgi:hypothetical protein